MKDISSVISFLPNKLIVILFYLIFDLGYGNCILMPSFIIMDSIYKIMKKYVLNITMLFQKRNSRSPLLRANKMFNFVRKRRKSIARMNALLVFGT